MRSAGYCDDDLFTANIFESTAAVLKVKNVYKNLMWLLSYFILFYFISKISFILMDEIIFLIFFLFCSTVQYLFSFFFRFILFTLVYIRDYQFMI